MITTITTIVIGALSVAVVAIFTEIIKKQFEQITELKIDHARSEILDAEKDKLIADLAMRVTELERQQQQ